MVINCLFEKCNSGERNNELGEFALATSLTIVGDALASSKNGLDLTGIKTISFIDSLNIY